MRCLDGFDGHVSHNVHRIQSVIKVLHIGLVLAIVGSVGGGNRFANVEGEDDSLEGSELRNGTLQLRDVLLLQEHSNADVPLPSLDQIGNAIHAIQPRCWS